MSNIFSNRFLAIAPGTDGAYTVPVGDTAVIRCVTALNSGPSVSFYYVQISAGPTYVVGGTLAPWQAAEGAPFAAAVDLRVVVNGGETITAHAYSGVHVTVSGYLFAT
jgi:hypothetical protein